MAMESGTEALRNRERRRAAGKPPLSYRENLLIVAKRDRVFWTIAAAIGFAELTAWAAASIMIGEPPHPLAFVTVVVVSWWYGSAKREWREVAAARAGIWRQPTEGEDGVANFYRQREFPPRGWRAPIER